MVFNIADILYQWEYIGLFDYVLPFLLVFAITFGILSSTRFMGENKAVYLIVSLVIGLMTLRWSYFFSDFLSELFPRLGIGLSIMVAVLILVGLFIAKDETRYWGYGLAGIGLIIGSIIVYQSFERLGWFGTYIDSNIVSMVILGILIVAVFIAFAFSDRERDREHGIAAFIPGTGWSTGMPRR